MSAEGIYPLSTQDGKNIPLDVIRPKSLVSYGFKGDAATAITIPAGFALCWAYATQDCFLCIAPVNLPSSLVDGTPYPFTVFIPAGTPIVIMVVPGQASLLGFGSQGTLILNWVEQWAALAQQQQTSVG